MNWSVIYLYIADFFVRVRGIEPRSQPWEGRILPLNHTRRSICIISNLLFLVVCVFFSKLLVLCVYFRQ